MLSRQAMRATVVLAQLQALAETRLQRVTSVAKLLEEAQLEAPSSSELLRDRATGKQPPQCSPRAGRAP
jgi:hypothetical protein